MKLASILLAGALLAPLGCKTASAPAAPPAPGYLNAQDQIIGQALASLDTFVRQATADYATLTPAQQASEKSALNNMVTAVNIANSLYLAYHNGTSTEAQAQTALVTAQSAQTNYTSVAGVKQ
ncbi:MAG TPA: hypothetical protein VGK96_28375 [Candidatus Sulfotelmatobacter sp.]|jgi:carbohydrate-binding DOMON domain-containing protein